MSSASKRFANLSLEKKRALAAQLLREKARPPKVFPLSFAQRRLWFLDQLMPNSPLYNIPAALHLDGALDLALLQRSLATVVQRHDSLRTTFRTLGERPVQVIAPTQPVALPLLDLQAWSAVQRMELTQQLALAEARQPFELSHGPLIRARLLRLAASEHVLLLTLHHIIADGWSIGVLVRELTTLYAAYRSGVVPQLAALPVQYADFTLWQQTWLQGAVLETQLAYWRRQLAGLVTLNLPTDRPRPAFQTFHGARQSVVIAPTLGAALNRVSQQHQATLFMTLLAAFMTLLQRYSGQDDITVGSPIANRTRTELEGLIGFFVNTLVLRAELDSRLPFAELLARVRALTLAAYAHQDLPFEQLVEELQPVRDPSHNPLFQVMFVLQNQNAPMTATVLPDLRVQLITAHNQTAKVDLWLGVTEETQGLSGMLEYNTDLFDDATITRLGRQLQTLLENIVAAPEMRIGDLPLLTAHERSQLIAEWNDTLAACPTELCIQALFEAQAARTPDAVAVVFDSRDKQTGRPGDQETTGRTTNDGSAFSLQPSAFSLQLTYAELNARANQLAHHLRARGVGTETTVGICMERSPELIVGLLAILKAGGAYLPLDPAYPGERLAFMLEDAGVRVLIVATGDQDKESGRQGDKERIHLLVSLSPCLAVVVDLDVDWPSIAQLPETSPDSDVRADNLAYVIYTSGSTGRPKGVAIPHQGLLNLVFWHQRTYAVTPDDRATQLAGLSFDASVWELWPYLAVGASIVLADEATRMAPERLQRWLVSQAITLSFLPTPLAEAVLALERPVASLRALLTGGDRLRSFPAAAHDFSLVNHYGPTECSVVASAAPIIAPNERTRLPLIGRPIANTHVYILDQHMQPVPIGVPGELFIGGLGLARGYLGRPDLTAERFVPNPFVKVSGARYRVSGVGISDTRYPAPNTRLYKTGDLARYLPDGSLDFLGRIDQQVKLRGFRIEPGEIEAVLAAHAAVQECVVLLRTDAPGAAQLVAYVVPQNVDTETRRQGDKEASDLLVSLSPGLTPQAPSFVPELRSYLQARLPDYMVPTLFVQLDHLPRTPNGKLDRKGLPAPIVEFAAPLLAPRTPLEVLLAAIWSQLLDRSVGIDDNFFALGGHSLLATQVIARIRDACAVELPLRSIFETPTVAGLAVRVKEALQQASQRSVPPITPVAHSGPLPLSFAQQRLWFLDQLVPNSPLYNIPAALHLDGALDLALLQRSLATIVQRHDSLRTTFRTLGERPVQVIAPTQPVALPLLDLQACLATQRPDLTQQLALAEARQPFELSHGPLIRARLLRLAASEHVLLLTLHHIIADGWSIGVLVRELTTLYAAYRSGVVPQLAALPVQYADFTLWQQTWLQGAVLEAQLAYWRRQLAGLVTLNLPTDRPRPAFQTFHGARQSVIIPPTLGAALNRVSRQRETTLFMILLAAFMTLLARYSGQDDIAVGSPIANRTRTELEGLIGFFVNTLVLRAELDSRLPFAELLARVRALTLAAYAHQDLPFEQLVEELQPVRDPSHNPLFQVMFVLQNAPMTATELPDLRVRPIIAHNQTAKFDLWLGLTEEAQGLYGALEYNTDLFHDATVTRLRGHLLALLDGVAANPERHLADLPLLRAAEQQQIVYEWNDTRVAYPTEPCIHTLFAAQAARTPDAVAVVLDTLTKDEGRWTNEAQYIASLTPAAAAAPPLPRTGDKRSAEGGLAGGEGYLTYAALDQRANQLARHLRSLGVADGMCVGICLDRSLDMLVGLLGILKAGAAYLPLDPASPPERLAFMLADSQVRVLLVATGGSTDTETGRQADKEIDILLVSVSPCLGRVVDLHADWPLIARQAATPLASTVSAAHWGYVIYTSGSTGTPKGMAMSHRALVNLLHWQLGYLEHQLGTRFLQFASLSFDVSYQEIFPTLASGGVVVLISEELRRDADALWQLLSREQVERIYLPYVGLQQLAEAATPHPLPRALRQVTVSGEQLQLTPAITRMFRLLPGTLLHNFYGPSESHAISAHTLRGVPEHWPTLVPIGRPIANAQLYVLDGQLRPLPLGVVGELYIGGVGLVDGYLGRADLTAERFVPNPFAETNAVETQNIASLPPDPAIATRLYATGDLARVLADGSLGFLGRRDGQVKVRGYRVELEEVAAVLAQHAAVQECVVLLRTDASEAARLVAYVVEGSGVRGQGSGSEDKQTSRPGDKEITNIILSGPRPLTPDPRSLIPELRAFLQARLPEYMQPAAFVLLARLPLTINGKVDRKALPLPDRLGPTRENQFVAPRSLLEELLARIWEELLGIVPIGIDDNFFELGGHSLLATQVIARVRQAAQVALPVRAIFQAPTIAGLAELLSQARRSERGLDQPPLRPQPRDDALPLSFAQQRLWFLDQLLPNSPLYNIPIALRLAGSLHVAALRHSLQAIVQRHEALRTTFVARDGQPVQLIAPTLAFKLALIDFREYPPERRQATVIQLAVAEARQPFDLEHGPLLRARLLWLGTDEYVLLLTLHHIIADGWSMGVLVRELTTLYDAFVRGVPPMLPALPVQYADFAIWQRGWLQGAVLETQLAYWRRQLAELPALDLPTDQPRPALATFRGARQPVRVPEALTARLLAVSRQNSATLFMTVLAAFTTVLARASGQTDIPIGVPIANRTWTEIEGLIGFFVNTLVLRADLTGDPSFRELLARVREVTLDAHTHQDMPFEKLVEELQPVRDPSRNPLFQVMLVMQSAMVGAVALPNLTFSPLDAHNQTAKFDLWMGLSEGPEGLRGALEYNTDLFDDATITRLRGHLLALLDGVAATSERRLADLPLLRAAEQQQLLHEWNDTRVAYPTEPCIHTLFAAQAARTPDAVAVVFDTLTKDEGRWTNGAQYIASLTPAAAAAPPLPRTGEGEGGEGYLTYAALDQRANQLARHLRSLGVAEGMCVGICLDRSLDMLVGLLGILKAGAAYLPLDPASPSERLAFMLADSQVRVLLVATEGSTDTETGRQADKEIAHSLVSLSPSLLVSRTVVDLAADWPLIARQAATPLASTVSAAHWGYVIYTSGSTGTPKGMAMSHRALVNLLHWQLGYLEHQLGTRFLQFASLSFDVSYQEIFPTLASGGVVVLIDEELRRDADALWQLLVREQVERIYLPYVGLQQLAEAATPHALPRALRQVTVSGEQLQITPAISRMFTLLPGTVLHNFYGPSESHAITAHTLRGVPEHWPTLVPIGRPIANAQLYVLDGQLRPLPIGVVGELYIGGVGLVDGYLGRADLTAERFVPNPFLSPPFPPAGGGAAGGVLYRTGDLARVLADGSLSFLGRRDGQVKVRGYRVELEEVAAVLAQHAAVQECVVLLRTDAPGAARLVAYVVPTEDEGRRTNDEGADSSFVHRPSSIVSDLRSFLQARLPEYMQPAAFVLLERLPLTINGKVDRKALPLPEPEQRMLERAVEPQTPLERELAAIWAEVLHIEQIGRHENFFALGGHSLLATQVVSRVRQHAGMDLPLRTLFEAPTVAGLAERIEALRLAAQHLQTSSDAAVGDDEEEGEL